MPTGVPLTRTTPSPARIDVGFAPALAGRKVDVEQMELVVARANLAFAIDQEAAVGDLAIAGQDRERAEVKPDPVATRRLAAGCEHLIVLLRRGGFSRRGPNRGRESRHLRA